MHRALRISTLKKNFLLFLNAHSRSEPHKREVNMPKMIPKVYSSRPLIVYILIFFLITRCGSIVIIIYFFSHFANVSDIIFVHPQGYKMVMFDTKLIKYRQFYSCYTLKYMEIHIQNLPLSLMLFLFIYNLVARISFFVCYVIY